MSHHTEALREALLRCLREIQPHHIPGDCYSQAQAALEATEPCHFGTHGCGLSHANGEDCEGIATKARTLSSESASQCDQHDPQKATPPDQREPVDEDVERALSTAGEAMHPLDRWQGALVTLAVEVIRLRGCVRAALEHPQRDDHPHCHTCCCYGPPQTALAASKDKPDSSMGQASGATSRPAKTLPESPSVDTSAVYLKDGGAS